MAGVNKRSRCWWFVQLIDNLPEDWESKLYDMVLPGCYIVHDQDTKLDIETGELLPVAPHVHCLVEFGNAVLAKTVLDVLPEEFGVLHVEPVPTKVGAYRYLLHLGHEEKHEYQRDEMKHLHGFRVNMSDVYNVDFSDVYSLINEMQIDNFAVLMSFLVEFKPDFVPYVSAHVNLVRSFLMERSKL